jgi:fructosamine-3-kinase
MDADRLTRLIGTPVVEVHPLPGGSICQAARLRLADGRSVFAKAPRAAAPADFFTAEARGLAWLAAAPTGPPVPAVLAVDAGTLVLDWIDPAAPTTAAADRFGAELAALHLAGADHFGAPWPGYIGSIPMDNTPTGESWPEFYALRRIEPYVRTLRDTGALADPGPFDRLAARLPTLAGPPEPPARLHGDLWSGNLVWTADRVQVVDPAAHGGHRETDLAMLRLFGAPQLAPILDSYANSAADRGSPLAAGWPDRAPLHQVFPLLVHAVIFGGTYLDRALAVARRYAG